MKCFTSISFATILAIGAQANSLPACSDKSITPCSCPAGTDYSQSVTFAVIGAAAKDVRALIADCKAARPTSLLSIADPYGTVYKCAWLGVVPYAFEGPDNTPGVSIRTSRLPTLVGVNVISEKACFNLIFTVLQSSFPITPYPTRDHPLKIHQLTTYKTNSTGSFTQAFEQLPSTVPVEYPAGNGSFSGYWVTLESTAIFEYETAIRWSIYACETGHARSKCT